MMMIRNGFWLLLVCLSMLMEPCFAAAAANAPASGATPLPTPIGKVVWIKGTLTAEMPNKETRNLQKKSIIYLHDILVTDEKSQAEIVFTDNSLITFKEGSKFSVDTYKLKKGGANSSFVGTLATGGFRTITGLIAHGSANNYQVNTPVATIGVRGTDFQVVLHNGALYMAVYKGKPCAKNKPTDLKKKATELCLDKDHPYLEVPDANSAPVPLSQAPLDLGEQLIITQAYIAPFSSPSSSNGPITSFCITE